MRIDFVSDVSCPWCAVGLYALERALERVGDEVPVELHFQPFELNPGLEPEGRDIVEYLGQKYGKTPQDIAQTQATIRERGAAVGFAFGQRERTWNTFDAHRLLHWAGLQGRQRELKHALLQAYHGEGQNPAPRGPARLRRRRGLDEAEAKAVIGSARYADEVRAQIRHFQQLGIHAVPSIIVNGKPPDPGRAATGGLRAGAAPDRRRRRLIRDR